MTELSLLRSILDLTGQTIVAILLLILVYKLINRWLAAVIASQKDFSESLDKVSAAVSSAVKEVGDYVARDNREHKEILLTVQSMAIETESQGELMRGLYSLVSTLTKNMEQPENERTEDGFPPAESDQKGHIRHIG